MAIDATTNAKPGACRGKFGGLWGRRDFRLFWAGDTISLFGSQITLLALPLTAALLLHATATQMGILRAVEYLPFLLLTPLAGVWVDRARRRPILLATNIGCGALLGVIPLLAWFGGLRIGALFAVAGAVGALTVFFELAYQSFLPSLLPPDDLVDGNSKLFASASLAEIGGPGLGGLLVQAITAPFAILADALSFLVSAVALASLRVAETAPVHPRERPPIRAEIAAGFRTVLSHPYLRPFVGEAATFNFFWNALSPVFVLYAVRTLHFSPGTLGFILAGGSVGGLLGAVVTGRLAARFGVGRTMVGAAALSCLVLLVLPLAVRPMGGATVAMLGGIFFLNGAGVTACNVHAFSLRQASTPDTLRGRMNATYRLISWGAIPPGALLGGALGAAIGLYPTLIVASVGLSTAWLWVFWSPVRGLRTIGEAGDRAP